MIDIRDTLTIGQELLILGSIPVLATLAVVGAWLGFDQELRRDWLTRLRTFAAGTRPDR